MNGDNEDPDERDASSSGMFVREIDECFSSDGIPLPRDFSVTMGFEF